MVFFVESGERLASFEGETTSFLVDAYTSCVFRCALSPHPARSNPSTSTATQISLIQGNNSHRAKLTSRTVFEDLGVFVVCFVCFVCLFVCLSVCLSVYLLLCLFVCLFICWSVCSFVCLFVCLFVSVCLFLTCDLYRSPNCMSLPHTITRFSSSFSFLH